MSITTWEDRLVATIQRCLDNENYQADQTEEIFDFRVGPTGVIDMEYIRWFIDYSGNFMTSSTVMISGHGALITYDAERKIVDACKEHLLMMKLAS